MEDTISFFFFFKYWVGLSKQSSPRPGSGCSKLMTLLVNTAKAFLIFSTKNQCICISPRLLLNKQSDQGLYCLWSPSSGLSTGLRSSGHEFKPRLRRNLLNLKLGSIAHSLSLLTSYCPDMTEILL